MWVRCLIIKGTFKDLEPGGGVITPAGALLLLEGLWVLLPPYGGRHYRVSEVMYEPVLRMESCG